MRLAPLESEIQSAIIQAFKAKHGVEIDPGIEDIEPMGRAS